MISQCHQCEGLHVVEHILLRPAAAAEEHACGSERPDRDSAWLWKHFYPLRFSVFFPGWTPRCRDPEFRSLAEETVRINSPAHVYGRCFWLDFEQMCKLEKLFGEWGRTRQQLDADRERADGHAVRLINFVLSMDNGCH